MHARRLMLLLGVLVTAAAGAPLPRIGLAGALRLGCGGVLLRAGLPADYLGPREQCDLATLQRYDLVFCARRC